ncbi:MAG: hypothetical protein RSB87_00765 [Clostridia bacterium]
MNNKKVSKTENKKLKKRGSEVIQFVLLTVISSIVIIAVVYPTFKNLTAATSGKLEMWFNETIETIMPNALEY